MASAESPLVLIIDDDPDSRILISRMMKQENLRVSEAEGGLEGVAAFSRLHPDLVLLDAMMPDMDGFETCARLRALPDNDAVPILMITGMRAEERVVNRAFEMGATDYVSKPVNAAVLRQRVRRLIRTHQAEVALRRSEHQYRTVVENLKEVIFQVDQTGCWTFLNPAWTEITGFSVEESLGKASSLYIYPDDQLSNYNVLQPLLDGEVGSRHYEIRYLTKDGYIRWMEVFAQRTIDREIELKGISGTLNDISQRKRYEQTLQTLNEQLQESVENLEERRNEAEDRRQEAEERGKELVERNNQISRLSEMVSMLPLCESEQEIYSVVQQFMEQIFKGEALALSMIDPESEQVETVFKWGGAFSRERFEVDECRALRRGYLYPIKDTTSEPLCQHLLLDNLPSSYVCVPIQTPKEVLGLLQLYLPYSVIDEFKMGLAASIAEPTAMALANLKLQETLRVQSIRDPLTGLFNRRYMEESLERELRRAKRSGRSLGVLMLDLDYFKRFNDTFGHDGGDLILRLASDFLQGHVRDEDVVCRFGGEEFILILPEISLADAQSRAEFFRKNIKELQAFYNNRPLGTITASFGVAIYPNHGQTSEVLLKSVDLALYKAKANGRDRVETAD